MTSRRSLSSAAVGLVAAAILVQAATAAGEPKNEWPFTRPVEQSSTQPAIQGEAKNEVPFTRPATVVVTSSGDGFSWTDAAIGGVAGLGIALTGAGAVLVGRKSPRTA